MSKIKLIGFFLTCLLSKFIVAQVPFKTGNIVVSRVGTGTSGLSTPLVEVFLDEYTPSGQLVQSVPLPTATSGSNRILTLPGDDASFGALTISPDGRFLGISGYDGSPGTDASSANKTVAIVDYNAVINSSTSIINTGRPYAAITNNGNDIWMGMREGFHRYTTLGSTGASTGLTSTATAGKVYIFQNQLYECSATSAVRQIGTGLPTSGTNPLVVLIGGIGSQGDIFMADLNPLVPGPDVIYRVNLASAIQKYSFDGTVWNSNGTVGNTADAYAWVTGVVSGSTVTLYMIRKLNGLSTGGGEIATVTDNSGHGGTFSGTPAFIVSRPLNNTSFRGISVVPAPLSVSVSTKAFLQGAYNSGLGRHKNVTTTWANVLNASALTQPYNVAPFNYAGTESVSNGFFTADDGVDTDILDWVLVELHDATTPSTIIARKACFIREDGKIVDLDKTSNPAFTGVGANNYYLVIKHRNHLPIRSATTVFVNGATPITYDFTTAQSQAYQNPAVTTNAAMKDFSGVFCMWGGNVNANNNTKYTGPQNDALALLAQLSANQAAIVQLPGGDPYKGGDVNMDGVIRYTGPNNDALALLAVLSANQAAVINEHQ